MCINQIHSLRKFDEVTTLQLWIVFYYVLKLTIITQQNQGRPISCSHIWNFDIIKCLHWLDTESMKVWWRYNTSNMNCYVFCLKKNTKYTKYLETFHNLQLYLASQYIKRCVLIRDTFYESLMKICATKRKFRSFLLYFLGIGQCFWSVKTVLEVKNR